MPKMDMVDLKSQYAKISDEIDAAVLDVVRSCAYINGPEVKTFQLNLEEYLDVKHVIPCANGTDALQIAMMALGLQPGDEVITTSFTYIATVEVLALLKLTPVLIDVDPNSFCMDPSKIEEAIIEKTKAIVPVHLYGQGADMKPIMELARKHDLFVVEDAAQSLGTNLKSASGLKKLGTLADFGTTSFFPSKNLGCYGDGGALFTNSDELAAKARMMANHGQSRRYYHDHVGVNSRLDSIQAAVLNIKLKHLNHYNAMRQEAAARYDDAFASIEQVVTPKKMGYTEHIYHQYTIKLPLGVRDAFQSHMQNANVATTIYYPVAAHEQNGYNELVKTHDLSTTNDLCQRVISLPMHTEFTKESQQYIIDAVKAFFE